MLQLNNDASQAAIDDGCAVEPTLAEDTISPKDFTDRMTQRWIALSNTPSPRLRQLWATMAETFNEAVERSQDGTWRVLEPPTGSGKTQGCCVYAAMTIERNAAVSHDPLGMLIVTRTIAQADEVTRTIRELVNGAELQDRVNARHSDNKLNAFQMRNADVLVITHAAYTLALEGLNDAEHGRWSDFTTWDHGTRKLTVIDEALANIVEQNQITSDSVRNVLRYIDPVLKEQHEQPVVALEAICDVLEKVSALYRNPDANTQRLGQSKIVWKAIQEGRLEFPRTYSMMPLRDAMAGIRYDLKALHRSSQPDRQRIAKIVDDTLRDAEAILSRWAYYYKKGLDDTLNSSRLLIPDGLPGPVVLDATASQNFLWELMKDRAKRAKTPKGVRDYSNATMHAVSVTRIGKTAMEELGKTRIPAMLSNLEETLGPDRRVLTIVHKDVEHIAKSYAPKFKEYAVAHWGAIDGKNDWNSFDTVVCFGLPYLDDVWANNTFFALQGLQDNTWMQQPTWKDYKNVRTEMQRRQLAVSIIQAVNRVRCRRVVDVQGNCEKTDIFITLPSNNMGETLLGHLKDEMPNVRIASWDLELDGTQKRVRRGSAHEALLTFMTNRLPGETSISHLQKELGLNQNTLKDLKKTLRDHDHQLTKALKDISVSYVTGKGRNARSFLLKR